MAKRLAVAVEDISSSNQIVAEHFGRCTGFRVFNIDEENNVIDEEYYENPLNNHHGGTCQLPGIVKQFNADIVIAGGMGMKAIQLFHSFNIEVITAPGKKVAIAVPEYLSGKLSGFEECDNHSHGC